MRLLLIGVCIVSLVAADAATARTTKSSSGSNHSSSNGYITRKCKTAACFKKHPSGSYGFESGQYKRKQAVQ